MDYVCIVQGHSMILKGITSLQIRGTFLCSIFCIGKIMRKFMTWVLIPFQGSVYIFLWTFIVHLGIKKMSSKPFVR